MNKRRKERRGRRRKEDEEEGEGERRERGRGRGIPESSLPLKSDAGEPNSTERSSLLLVWLVVIISPVKFLE
jgi:hypothetical protein